MTAINISNIKEITLKKILERICSNNGKSSVCIEVDEPLPKDDVLIYYKESADISFHKFLNQKVILKSYRLHKDKWTIRGDNAYSDYDGTKQVVSDDIKQEKAKHAIKGVENKFLLRKLRL